MSDAATITECIDAEPADAVFSDDALAAIARLLVEYAMDHDSEGNGE